MIEARESVLFSYNFDRDVVKRTTARGCDPR
nr:MAG TPA: hypothetical protein [Caudoviricetes sp.]